MSITLINYKFYVYIYNIIYPVYNNSLLTYFNFNFNFNDKIKIKDKKVDHKSVYNLSGVTFNCELTIHLLIIMN